MKSQTRSSSILTAIGLLVAVLVVVAVVLALRPTEVFDPTTPEGTAQGYYEAVIDGDENLAFSYTTEELREACGGTFGFYEEGEDARIVITDSDTRGDTTRLDVVIEVQYGENPFSAGSYKRDETITMERRGDRWLISKPTWPMYQYQCDEPAG